MMLQNDTQASGESKRQKVNMTLLFLVNMNIFSQGDSTAASAKRVQYYFLPQKIEIHLPTQPKGALCQSAGATSVAQCKLRD